MAGTPPPLILRAPGRPACLCVQDSSSDSTFSKTVSRFPRSRPCDADSNPPLILLQGRSLEKWVPGLGEQPENFLPAQRAALFGKLKHLIKAWSHGGHSHPLYTHHGSSLPPAMCCQPCHLQSETVCCTQNLVTRMLWHSTCFIHVQSRLLIGTRCPYT